MSEGKRTKASSYAKKLIREEPLDGLTGCYVVDEIIYTGKSQYQEVDIAELVPFGRSLIIDEMMQSSEKDEFSYHESLVHPALTIHPNPRHVMVAGGGEGATVREILRHKSVEKVTMVDIDTLVIEASKSHLPNHHRGCFDNPRLELVIEDARAWLERYEGKFDVIIMDLADPVEEGPAFGLYTVEFFAMAQTKLNENGIILTQSGPAGLLTAPVVCVPIHQTMKRVFQHTLTYRIEVPSFLDVYSFTLSTNSDLIRDNYFRSELIDEKIGELLDASHEIGSDPQVKGADILRCYDSETHRHMIMLPKWFRHMLSIDSAFITDSSPKFLLRV